MKKTEVEQAIPTLCDLWAKATGQPMPPDSQFHYSFSSFYSWVQQHHHAYTQFRAEPSAREVMEMRFNQYFRQTWRE